MKAEEGNAIHTFRRNGITVRTKNLYVSRKFNQYRKEDLERITSEEGILLRVNRSIQSEGIFGDLKEDTGFRRFRYRGKRM